MNWWRLIIEEDDNNDSDSVVRVTSVVKVRSWLGRLTKMSLVGARVIGI